MTIREIYSELNSIFSKEFSCSWDNDGLMVCSDSAKEVKKVLLALDATATVVEKSDAYDLILTHHPIIFKKIGSVTDQSAPTSKLIKLLTSGTAVMSFHTRFDAGNGGMNDILAQKFGLRNVEKFGPDGDVLIGRIGDVDECSVTELAQKTKELLGSPCVLYTDTGKTIKKVAVSGGDGGSMIYPALAKGADVLITGRGGYNINIDAKDAGIAVIEAGHYYSEFVFVEYFKSYFEKRGISVDVCDIGCEIQML